MNPIVNGLESGWQIALIGLCLLVLVACVADVNNQKGSVVAPESSASEDAPSIDLAVVKQSGTKTATFALG